MNKLAICFALIVFLTCRKCACLLKRSTIVHIPLFPCMDFGNPKIKSIELLFHGAFENWQRLKQTWCFAPIIFDLLTYYALSDIVLYVLTHSRLIEISFYFLSCSQNTSMSRIRRTMRFIHDFLT